MHEEARDVQTANPRFGRVFYVPLAPPAGFVAVGMIVPARFSGVIGSPVDLHQEAQRRDRAALLFAT